MSMPDEELEVLPPSIIFSGRDYWRPQVAELKLVNRCETETAFWVRARRDLGPLCLLSHSHGVLQPKATATITIFLLPLRWDSELGATSKSGELVLLIKSLNVSGWGESDGGRSAEYLRGLFFANRAERGINMVMCTHNKVPVILAAPPPPSDLRLSAVSKPRSYSREGLGTPNTSHTPSLPHDQEDDDDDDDPSPQ